MFGAGNMQAAAPSQSILPIPQGVTFELENILSLETIRIHTKTEDIPAVTDEQLKLYRRAAYEAAELYTGLLFTRTQRLEENVKRPRRYVNDLRHTYTHTLKFPVSEPRVYVYGPGTKLVIDVEVGARKVVLPNSVYAHILFDCCNPCEGGAATVKVMYVAGYKDEAQIPAGITMGVLKYIAWSVGNPGDVLKTVDNRAKMGTDFLKGTNDAAWGSGAIDEWRRYVNDF